MENLLFEGVPILKHIRVVQLYKHIIEDGVKSGNFGPVEFSAPLLSLTAL